MPQPQSFDWQSLSAAGLYTIPLASRLLGEKQRVVRSWLDGYKHSEAGPLIVRQIPQIGQNSVFGFLDLVEARFIKHFCDLGLSPQSIRKVAENLRAKYKEDHPFAMNKRFVTDGRRVFMEVVDTEEERRVIDVLTENFVMRPVIEQSLFDAILYAEDLAYRWRPFPDIPRIVLDPKVAFGRPIVENSWTPTSIIYRAFAIERDMDAVADEYRLTKSDVEQAVEFERRLTETPVH